MAKDKVTIRTIGSTFPKTEVKTSCGKLTLPDEYEGQWFVLFSHPADYTPVCTSELISFANRREEFNRLNCELIGLSLDEAHIHEEWLADMEEKFEVNLDFPVIADEEAELARRLGLIHQSEEARTERATIIVDPEGTIRLIDFYPIEIGRRVGEVLRALDALQVSDENDVTLPANWPDNELIGDDVMVDPDEARERDSKRQLHGDWWFCHRQL